MSDHDLERRVARLEAMLTDDSPKPIRPHWGRINPETGEVYLPESDATPGELATWEIVQAMQIPRSPWE
jgi:hypothetical protein